MIQLVTVLHALHDEENGVKKKNRNTINIQRIQTPEEIHVLNNLVLKVEC